MGTLFLRNIFFLLLLTGNTLAFSQSNAEIQTSAELLTNFNDWCSANAAYSTQDMNSEQPFTKCSNTPLRFAKWFKFKASTPSVEINVRIGNSEGTLKFPYITLRDESLNELACVQYNDELEDIVLNYSELTPGKNYFFSVNNHNHSKYAGTFTLCATDVESNDFLVGAVRLWDLNKWCSGKGEFSTQGGTADGKAPSCIPKGPNFNKWFIFQANTPDIEIKALTEDGYGSAKFPIITLWDDTHKELACNSYNTFLEEPKVAYSGLKIGNLYYISVDHMYNEKYKGTFALCVNNFTVKKALPDQESQALITGKLFYKSGPLASGKVILADEKGNTIKTIVTDSKGKFRFDQLSAGKSYQVKLEIADENLGADIFLIKPDGEILKKTVRDKNIFRFEELPAGCNFVMLIDCSDTRVKIDQGKIGIIGRMLSKKNPVDPVARQRVYLMNNPMKILDSTLTDQAGKFQFINKTADQTYLLKMGEPVEDNYTEVVMINDKGNAIMTASSKTMDSKGFFRFEKLPAMNAEPIALKEAADERIDLSAVSNVGSIRENQVIVLDNIYFDPNEFKLLESSFEELNRLVRIMKDKSTLRIEISGHTDNSGNEQTNLLLSENRAKAVAEYLVAKEIKMERLVFKGFGSSKPVAVNDSDENRKKNRRVEFRIIK